MTHWCFPSRRQQIGNSDGLFARRAGLISEKLKSASNKDANVRLIFGLAFGSKIRRPHFTLLVKRANCCPWHARNKTAGSRLGMSNTVILSLDLVRKRELAFNFVARQVTHRFLGRAKFFIANRIV
jgi:hypothetical protein